MKSRPFRLSTSSLAVLLSGMGILLLLTAWLMYRYSAKGDNPEHVATQIATYMEEQVANLQRTTAEIQVSGKHNLPKHAQFGFFLYQGDSLAQWSRNDLIIPTPKPSSDTLYRSSNGRYWHHQLEMEDGNTIIGLWPMVREYDIQNRFLRNSLSFGHLLPPGLCWKPSGDGTAVSTDYGAIGLLTECHGRTKVTRLTVWIGIIGLLLLLSGLFGWGLVLASRIGYGWALMLMAALLVSARLAMLYLLPLGTFQMMEIFDPKVYSSSSLIPSLGDLVLNTLVLLTLAIWVFVYLPLHKVTSRWQTILYALASIAFIAISGNYILRVTQTLVLDSSITLDITYIYALNRFSLVAIVVLTALMTAWFLVAYRLTEWVYRMLADVWWLFPVVGGGLLVALLVLFQTTPLVQLLMATGVSSLFIVLLLSGHAYRMPIRQFWVQVTWIAFFGAIMAGYIYHFNQIRLQQHQRLYAEVLTRQDHLKEYLLNEVRGQITTDAFVKGYFRNPLISRGQLERRLRTLYFTGELANYSVQVLTYLGNDIPYKQMKPIPLRQLFISIDSSGRKTSVPDLYFFPEAQGGVEYMAMLRIYSDPNNPVQDNLLGRVVLLFKSPAYGVNTLYPELLLSETVRPSGMFNRFEYAIYLRNRLVKRDGDYPYPLQYKATGFEQFRLLDEGGYIHHIREEAPGRAVWVSRKAASNVEPLSLFSFLFCVLLAGLTTGNAIAYSLRYMPGIRSRISLRQVRFRSRIQFIIVFIIVTSFMLIGLLTIRNIKMQYEAYHFDRLFRKTGHILTGMEYIRVGRSDSVESWQSFLQHEDLVFRLTDISQIHAMDINVFSRDGHLIASSQPVIFQKGLLTSLIDPGVLHSLRVDQRAQYVQEEQIGRLKFISAYVPLLNDRNELEAVLNLPYYAKEKNMQDEINQFLSYFVNIYVLLFVVAGALGVLLSNSLTRPITVLGDKLKAVRLGQRNEPIVWRNKDEIGELLAQYNKMIGELEESANLLAQSERESAWREMAKQVAHEIKNPLTPMKLSIQLLQRAIRDGADDMDERVERVTHTLMEQIENLSRIASEFSNFAKMPTAEPEVLELNDVVKSVVELFRNESVKLTSSIPEQPYHVYADKRQMVRLFNNLLKNAIQAIPDDQEGEVFVALRTEGEDLLVKVEDNGVGIEPDLADKVFAPNFTTKTSGMGLGLAMCRQIVEFAGGRIWFEPRIGGGTVFYVVLPLST